MTTPHKSNVVQPTQPKGPMYPYKNNSAYQVKPSSPASVGTTKKKEYKFYEPKVVVPNWDMNMACLENNYFPLQINSKESNPDLAFRDTAQPFIFFGKNIMEEIRYATKIANAHTGEFAMYILYRRLNVTEPHWEVFGWFMTGQTASGSEVEMEGSDYMRYINYLKENYDCWESNINLNIGHLHSHGGLGVFWSGTDLKQQYSKDQLAYLEGHRLVVVVNAKNEMLAKYLQYTPVLTECDKINIGISFANPAYLTEVTKDRRKEIKEMVEDLVDKRSYGVSYASNYAKSGYPSHAPAFKDVNDWDDWEYRRGQYRINGDGSSQKIGPGKSPVTKPASKEPPKQETVAENRVFMEPEDEELLAHLEQLNVAELDSDEREFITYEPDILTLALAKIPEEDLHQVFDKVVKNLLNFMGVECEKCRVPKKVNNLSGLETISKIMFEHYEEDSELPELMVQTISRFVQTKIAQEFDLHFIDEQGGETEMSAYSDIGLSVGKRIEEIACLVALYLHGTKDLLPSDAWKRGLVECQIEDDDYIKLLNALRSESNEEFVRDEMITPRDITFWFFVS